MHLLIVGLLLGEDWLPWWFGLSLPLMIDWMVEECTDLLLVDYMNQLVNCFVDWSIDWQIGWLLGLIGLLVSCLLAWIDGSAGEVFQWLILLLTAYMSGLLKPADRMTYWLTYWLKNRHQGACCYSSSISYSSGWHHTCSYGPSFDANSREAHRCESSRSKQDCSCYRKNTNTEQTPWFIILSPL